MMNEDMSPLYYSTLRWVKRLLTEDYHLSAEEADAAIEFYDLKEFFEMDPEMAAHDGNEEWARRIYEYRYI